MRKYFYAAAGAIIILLGYFTLFASRPPEADSPYRFDGYANRDYFLPVEIDARQTKAFRNDEATRSITRFVKRHPNWDIPPDDALEQVNAIERTIRKYPDADFSDLLYYEIVFVGEILNDHAWAHGLCLKFLGGFPENSRRPIVEEMKKTYAGSGIISGRIGDSSRR